MGSRFAGRRRSHDDFDELAGAGGDLRVLAESITVPRQVVLFNSSLDAAVTDRITEILLGLHDSEDGRALLESFEKTTRFEQFGTEELQSTLAVLLDDSAP